jgi:hypothetical protein
VIDSIEIKNPKIQEVLDRGTNMDLLGNSVSRSRGFVESEYELIRDYSVSESYLNVRLKDTYPKIEYSHNLIIGDTLGGKYILDNLKSILEYDGFYTSGYDTRGFVGWHSDTDIFGWYIMLSYSTTGDGFFRYYEDSQIKTIPDTKGWMVRIMKLGKTEQDAIWHCAICNCTRYTFLLRFDSFEKYERALNIV